MDDPALPPNPELLCHYCGSATKMFESGMPICVRCDELGTGMLCQECLRLSLKLGSLAMEAMAIDNAADASREANRGRIPPHLYEWHSLTEKIGEPVNLLPHIWVLHAAIQQAYGLQRDSFPGYEDSVGCWITTRPSACEVRLC